MQHRVLEVPRVPLRNPLITEAELLGKRTVVDAALVPLKAAKTPEHRPDIIRAVAQGRRPGAAVSWKVELVADSSGQWCNNQVRFANRDEADAYGQHLLERWPVARQVRTVESMDRVNYRMEKRCFLPVQEP